MTSHEKHKGGNKCSDAPVTHSRTHLGSVMVPFHVLTACVCVLVWPAQRGPVWVLCYWSEDILAQLTTTVQVLFLGCIFLPFQTTIGFCSLVHLSTRSHTAVSYLLINHLHKLAFIWREAQMEAQPLRFIGRNLSKRICVSVAAGYRHSSSVQCCLNVCVCMIILWFVEV